MMSETTKLNAAASLAQRNSWCGIAKAFSFR